MEGNPSEVDYAYLDYMAEGYGLSDNVKETLIKPSEDNISKEKDETEDSNKGDTEEKIRKIKIVDVYLDSNGKRVDKIRVGEKVCLKVIYEKNRDVINPIMGVKIYRNDNVIGRLTIVSV